MRMLIAIAIGATMCVGSSAAFAVEKVSTPFRMRTCTNCFPDVKRSQRQRFVAPTEYGEVKGKSSVVKVSIDAATGKPNLPRGFVMGGSGKTAVDRATAPAFKPITRLKLKP